MDSWITTPYFPSHAAASPVCPSTLLRPSAPSAPSAPSSARLLPHQFSPSPHLPVVHVSIAVGEQIVLVCSSGCLRDSLGVSWPVANCQLLIVRCSAARLRLCRACVRARRPVPPSPCLQPTPTAHARTHTSPHSPLRNFSVTDKKLRYSTHRPSLRQFRHIGVEFSTTHQSRQYHALTTTRTHSSFKRDTIASLSSIRILPQSSIQSPGAGNWRPRLEHDYCLLHLNIHLRDTINNRTLAAQYDLVRSIF